MKVSVKSLVTAAVAAVVLALVSVVWFGGDRSRPVNSGTPAAVPSSSARMPPSSAWLGVSSTPTFFVDGERVVLEQLTDLETAIQAAR